MNKKYFSPTTFGFYPEEFKKQYEKAGNWPNDLVEITEADYKKYALGSSPEGKYPSLIGGVLSWVDVIPAELTLGQLETEERTWRNSELDEADIELNKVQDSDAKSVGSVADWRNYRKLLRSWPEHVEFPNKTFRPISPKNKE